MKGFRSAGQKKQALLEKINASINFLKKNGVDVRVEVCRVFDLKKLNDLTKLKTKQLSGVISYIHQVAL